MPDLTSHDALDDGFHEIQLSGKQLVFLFMAATVVLVIVFLCGVQVGRGGRIDRTGDGDQGASSAALPPTASTPSQAPLASGPPAAEPPAPAQDDDLSYAKRLQGEAPSDKLKPQTGPAPGRAAPPPALTPAPASAASKPAVKPSPKPAAPPPAVAATPAPASPSGKWIVQVTALQDRGAAAAMARRLVAKGYPAFVLDPAAGAPVVYRVQIGGYPDRAHAEEISRRLEKQEQMASIVRAR